MCDEPGLFGANPVAREVEDLERNVRLQRISDEPGALLNPVVAKLEDLEPHVRPQRTREGLCALLASVSSRRD